MSVLRVGGLPKGPQHEWSPGLLSHHLIMHALSHPLRQEAVWGLRIGILQKTSQLAQEAFDCLHFKLMNNVPSFLKWVV